MADRVPRFSNSNVGNAMLQQYLIDNNYRILPEVTVTGYGVANYPNLEPDYDVVSDELYPVAGQLLYDADSRVVGNRAISYSPLGLPLDTVVYNPANDSLYTSGHTLGRTRTPGFDQANATYELMLLLSKPYTFHVGPTLKNMIGLLDPYNRKPALNSKDIYPELTQLEVKRRKSKSLNRQK